MLQSRSPESPEYQWFPPPGRTTTECLNARCSMKGLNWRAAAAKVKKAAESDAALAAMKKLRAESEIKPGS